MDENTLSSAQRFDDLADDLYQLGAITSASEFHGMVCACLVANAPLQGQAWRAHCLEFLGLAPDQQQTPVLERVLALPDQAAVELAHQDYGFQLLLPPDDSELSQRAEELGNWCQGFLTGLALSGQDQQRWSALPEQLADGLSDLAEIAQIEAIDNDDEGDFLELFEFVRMVVLNAYAELRENRSSGKAPVHGASSLFGNDGKLH